MEEYIDYITKSIIRDVENFGNINDNYSLLTWIFVWILWLWWILVKYMLLTFPFWGTFNLMFNKTWKIQITKVNKPWDYKSYKNNKPE